jgi:hypothetical protein
VPIHRVDTTEPREKNVRDVRRALGLDFEALSFHRRPLEVLAEVGARLGIEAWVTSGHVYRSFWNGRFGPAQEPLDVDVAIDDPRDERPLLDALRAEAPDERWSVLAPGARLRERLGLATTTAGEAKALATWTPRTGLVAVRGGELQLLLPPGTEAALRRGAVQLNPRLLERLTPEQQRALLAKDGHRLPSVLRQYPGLTFVPHPLLPAGPHAPRDVKTSWRHLKHAVSAAPRVASGRAPHNRRRLTPPERGLAELIVAFHRHPELRPAPPPRPPARSVPAGTFASLAADADDATFANWIHARRGARTR